MTARECEVAEVAFDADHEEIHCRLAPGGGRNLAWTVRAGGQASIPSQETSSYATPVLHNVSVAPGATATTRGGFELLLEGRDLGSVLSTEVRFVDARVRDDRLGEAPGSSCDVRASDAHTRLRCVAPEGFGDVKVVVDVGGQLAHASLSYGEPRLLAHAGEIYSLPAVGGYLGVKGTDLAEPLILDAMGLSARVLWAADGEAALTPSEAHPIKLHTHTMLTFRVPAGVGAGMRFQLEIGGKLSNELPFRCVSCKRRLPPAAARRVQLECAVTRPVDEAHT